MIPLALLGFGGFSALGICLAFIRAAALDLCSLIFLDRYFCQRRRLDWGSNGLEPEKNGKNLDLLIPKLDDGPCHVGLLGLRAAGECRMPVFVLSSRLRPRRLEKASRARNGGFVDMTRTTPFVAQVHGLALRFGRRLLILVGFVGGGVSVVIEEGVEINGKR
jgi:hypothetical protein